MCEKKSKIVRKSAIFFLKSAISLICINNAKLNHFFVHVSDVFHLFNEIKLYVIHWYWKFVVFAFPGIFHYIITQY